MKMHKFIFILPFFIFFLAGCEKKADPNAYQKDPILADLKTKAEAMAKAVEAAQKELDGFKKELAEVKPQTGQIKFAQKRVFDAEAKITKLEQEKRYYRVAADSRVRIAKEKYKIAFKEGKPWPDMAEFETYQTLERLRNAKRSWDVKERFKEAGISIPGEEPPTKKPEH